MLGNFSCFCYRLLTFFKINFFEKFHLGTLSECQWFTNGLDQDQDWQTVILDLGPNHLQRFLADDKNRR